MSRLQIGKIKKDREYLRNLVFKKLQQAIYSEKIKFGEKITEREIVKEFGVSRTPVREALCMLNITGLIKFIPNGGFVIGKLTAKEIKNVMETRMVLEMFALRLAIQRIKPEEIEDLNLLLSKMERAVKNKDTVKMFYISNLFYDKIILASENQEIFNFIQLLNNKIYHFRNVSLFTPNELEEYFTEHKKMLNALKNKDEETVQKLAKKSIQRVNSIINRKIKK
ncbi:MAG: GntR family transcriptional regulator [Atribacterota bacterium]|nr:GntR family transcriptional regulator [Atribacterota bacterium]